MQQVLELLKINFMNLGESLGDAKDSNGSLTLGSLPSEPLPPETDSLPNLIMDTDSIISQTALSSTLEPRGNYISFSNTQFIVISSRSICFHI